MSAVASIVIAIVIISTVTTGVIYAQDIGTTQAADYSNSTLVKKLNANIIDTINARIRSVYGDDGWNYTKSATATITEVKHG